MIDLFDTILLTVAVILALWPERRGIFNDDRDNKQ